MNVVVVESPAKAKTITKYLGAGFTVLASYGHVRDLPSKNGSVDPDNDFSMQWEVDDRGEKQISDIARALKGAKNLYLATDPDREGEAISWHISEILRQKKVLTGLNVQRVVFHEITKNAVQQAIKNPRTLNQELIDAYLARRALDYLVGFTLSPVLWRKLPGSRSAGRVQSVALRLICEREAEIEAFKAQEYWSVEAMLTTPSGQSFTARLTHLQGQKLDKFSLANETLATSAVSAVNAATLTIGTLEQKRVRRHPPAPFTTSTLQQEASRKLGFGATRTMRAAQRLYEGVDIGGETTGLITYMRTDSVTMAGEAISGARSLIKQNFGEAYLPEAPRQYKTKSKNAQEAHEAVRPTDFNRLPQELKGQLDDDLLALYTLIWQRALASQMQSMELEQTTADITSAAGTVTLRANGSVVVFDGFGKLYEESQDDPTDEENRRLPPLYKGDALGIKAVAPHQHFTEPPPRYSEASLVKKMEELGIGRPSTYASILQVLQDRGYAVLDKKRFTPSDRGRIVTSFLTGFFQRYVEYSFTADLEEKLDSIAEGGLAWREVMRAFWDDFKIAIEATSSLTISAVINVLDQDLDTHFFARVEKGRTCPQCNEGRLSLKLGKFGAFIGCARYPDCTFTRKLTEQAQDDSANPDDGGVVLPKELGVDPETKQPVSLRRGPYGLYVQRGDAKDKDSVKRVGLTRGTNPSMMTLDMALRLLALPREVGKHPETGEAIIANIGRFGPYVQHAGVFASIPKAEDVLEVGLNRAVDLLAEKAARKSKFPSRARKAKPTPAKKLATRKKKSRSAGQKDSDA